ncbi:adenosylcobinamide-GDP ribazoletransferase [Chlorobium sp. BLA1]|uniref:adenosylcobinamide-GDP ribazoletransferase n=1 Tax=Candidatus Chlorobium masyuteum TaxID=2716876 RepID=UPI00142298C1|nr:adenosylcobinamide-GDP ribazoletransferase [Candidatus Chlorobium masyuteum]NHQ60959.1 adenosylcobinamide-GDP ribazoletransferase [Candidatus Chlorobium masyuteum]
MLSAFVSALRTLTVFSVPGRDTDSFSNTLFWFPVVGLLLGVLQALLGYAGHLSGWNELAAALVVFGGVILTRGMHLDGLADLSDGFWGGRTRESALRIMKDPNVGSFGSIALSMLLLLKWIAVLKLVEFGAFTFIAAGVLLARLMQVGLASLLPYARSEGGTAQAFVTGAGWMHILVALLLTLLFLFPLLHQDMLALLALLAAAIAAGGMTGLLSYKKIQGVTGDVLGAASELTELFVWISAALYLLLSGNG